MRRRRDLDPQSSVHTAASALPLFLSASAYKTPARRPLHRKNSPS